VNIYKLWLPQNWGVSSQAIRYSGKILHPGAIYIASTKKIPMYRGGDDTLASSILPIVLLPLPSCLSTSRRWLSLGKAVITNMCNMPGRNYKKLLYAGDGNEQPNGKIQRGNICDFFL